MKLPFVIPTLVMLVAWGFWLAEPASAGAAAQTQPVVPQVAGFHDLYQGVHIAGQQRRLAYSVFLPKGYDPSRRWPMLVYLIGVGDRGNNADGLYNNGPPTALKIDQGLADWAPFIVLSPQCPPDLRWDSPGMAAMVMEMVDVAKKNWSVDDERVYLTGLSMGGSGAWRVALESHNAFAAIAVISAAEVAPDRVPDCVKGATVLIIAGGADGGFATGSRHMAEVLAKAGVDVVHVEIPGAGHCVWPGFYASRQFYEFLLMHQRGHKPPTTRPSADQLRALNETRPNTADAQIVGPLQQFLPWWFISNCGKSGSPGLRGELLGRRSVFVTSPAAGDLPCRLLYTAPIPADSTTSMNMIVAAHPEGQWDLIVRASGAELLRRTVRGVSGTDPWTNVSVDLTPLAGKTVFLEVLNSPCGSAHAEAYWAKVELVSKPVKY